MKWVSKPIGAFCQTGSGGTPSRQEESRFYGGRIPWVKSGELKEAIIFGTEETITEAALTESSAKLIPSGALLVAMYGATVGRIAILGIEAASNQAVCHIVPDESVADQRYLFYALRKQVPRWLEQRVGGAQPNINQQIIRDTQIPLPSIAQQRRIAEILDRADAIRRKRQEAIQLTEELLRSTFLEMFGDPEHHEWELTTVEFLASSSNGSIRTGPFGSQLLHSEFVSEGIAVLGIDNAVKNQFQWAQPRFISQNKYEQLRRYTVYSGDVLITIMGTCGRCAIVPDDCPTAINTKHLCCITLDRERCLPEFLHSYFLMHPYAERYLEKTIKGAIMDGLNMGIIKQLPVPLVPIELQRRYSALWHKLFQTRQRVIDTQTQDNNLFNSLLQRAFRGEL